MLIPNPIVFDLPPEGGSVLPVSSERGGLEGYFLLGLEGPEATVELSTDNGDSWQAVVYPYRLVGGNLLRLSRSDTSSTLSVLRALAPVDDGPPPEAAATGLSVTVNPDGYLTSDDNRISTDPDGYLSAPDNLTQADNDGYLSEVTV